MVWWLLLLMAFITFTNRYAFLSPRLKFAIGPKLQSLLQYTAPAVLTALWVPIVFVREDKLNLQLDNPYFIAGLFTIMVSLLIKKPLLTVILGITVFLLLSRSL